eukprot:TRINITY_DN4125_c0_g2_i1.p1 TRINITY_DN4125_c0_g2~~TRINITY_DN4125_c0_g2_i1.p1  ORF type:complete len:707 (+),score=121.25 TRINITY_DN4125_c0_g2_i1:67-2121(+)
MTSKPLNVQSAKVKLNELFIYWLTLPETQEMITKLERAGGKMGAGTVPEHEILVDQLQAISPMISLDRVDSNGSERGGGGNLSFTSPPRSPRASPSHVARQSQIASPLVDELDVAHRQGAMSPHGSPRGVHRLASPEPNPAPSSPGKPRMAGLSLGSPAQSLQSDISSFNQSMGGASTTSSPGSQSLSAAFAHIDAPNQQPSLSASHKNVSPLSTPTTEMLQPVPKKKLTGEPRIHIPRFYFPKGKAPLNEDTERQWSIAKRCYETKKPGAKAPSRTGRKLSDAKMDKALTLKAFVELTSRVCLLPKWMNEIVFRRVLCYTPGAANYDKEKERSITIHATNTTVSYQKFKDFFEHEMVGKSKERRLFDSIKWDKTREHIIPSDLTPLIREILLVHPGLEFLKVTPDFQDRYADTVRIRIMYSTAMRDDSIITWADFCNSTLFDVLHILDTESDINVSNKTEYFSYEHFYVLYCKFWELDTDHDFYLSKEDLAKYGNYCLTSGIIDRIFSGKGRMLRSDVPGKMSYEDFVWFCLCEEDKTTARSLEYWFKCTDNDEDGLLSGFELNFYFKEQKQRMEASFQETISYDDILCQMIDMIHPEGIDGLRLSDFKNCRLSGNFFNALFNLTKFIAFEQRDPFMAHAEKQMVEKTDWDRFAKIEYDRMSHEAGEQEDISEDFGIGLYDGG